MTGTTAAFTDYDCTSFSNGGALTTDADGNLVCSADDSGGGSSNSFETISVPAGTNPVADSSTDTLTITETTFLTITGTAGTDTIDITQVTTDLGTDGLIAANAVALSTDTTGNYVLDVADGTGIDGTAAAEGATYTPSLDLTEITCGAGIACASATAIATASSEADFLVSGALTCGASTQGKAQVHTTPLQYCDNAATPALQYAAYGDSAGNATGVACTGCVTTADAASLDISDDTNLAGDTEIVLTGDALSIATTITRDAEWDTEGEVQTAWGSVNILLETEIDASSELLALMDDETGTGVLVFGTSPTIATPALTGAYDLNNVAVDDDDCTGQQGQGWYDSTDSAWEFCNANSGAPATLAAASGDITDVFNCASGDCASIAVTDGDLLDFTNVNNSATTEGIILPQGTAPTGGTAEGQIAWETDVDELLIGTGSAQIRVGAFLMTTGWNASRTGDFNISWGGDSGNDEGMIVPAMTCRNLRAQVDVAPGVGNSWVVTLRDDGATTLLTCTMSNTTSCSNTSDVVSIAADSIIDSFWDANTTVTASAGQSAVMECYLD